MSTNVLILCTHNSARSVLSEGMMNHWALRLGKDVRAYSAGSAPSGRLNPLALEALSLAGVDTRGYRSKSWDEFTGEGAPEMRIVITVCDSAAGGDEGRKQAFELTRQAIGYRMRQLVDLPFDAMGDAELRAALSAIAGS